MSSDDGRIKGYDWGVHDDASFQRFLSHHGWTNAGNSARDEVSGKSSTRVNVVQSNDEQNEFFFPGFIGMFMISSSFDLVEDCTD